MTNKNLIESLLHQLISIRSYLYLLNYENIRYEPVPLFGQFVDLFISLLFFLLLLDSNNIIKL